MQLEGLVVGDSIERRESDKFPGRGHLARRFNQLHSDGTQSPKVSWRKVFFLLVLSFRVREAQWPSGRESDS